MEVTFKKATLPETSFEGKTETPLVTLIGVEEEFVSQRMAITRVQFPPTTILSYTAVAIPYEYILRIYDAHLHKTLQ